MAERLGAPPKSRNNVRTQPRGIWLHAVSVGEVLSSIRLITELRAAHPGRPISVSVGTVAGRQLADKRLSGLADHIFYAPLDYAWCVRRVLRRVRPSLVIILETEIWPNLWRETVRTGARLLVINGRLSDRAWPRYQSLAWFFGPMLRLPGAILAQDATSKDRYLQLGANPSAVQLAGNLKFDLNTQQAQPPAAVNQLLDRLPSKRVWIAASTMPPAEPHDPDEDSVVIDAFRQLKSEIPDLLLILVPRKPESFDTAAEKLGAADIPYLRRSKLTGTETLALPGVLLVDTMGELNSLFPLADVVFMGGTLASRGGHNILEPAFAARPVIVGPHMENFAEIAAAFRGANALIEIESAQHLVSAVRGVLIDGDSNLGERGLAVAEAGRGATARAVQRAASLLTQGVEPIIVASFPLRAAAALWFIGSAAHRLAYQRGILRTKRLPWLTVSIGGIAAGGTGKTPIALWLAAQLKKRFLQPVFLTRGYRRQSREAVTLVPAGAQISATETGDEAQLLVRSGLGSVCIGADRHAAATKFMLAGGKADLFLLDDGFQHFRLARDFNLVVLDALDPFAGGRLLPAGRLREFASALARANAIVLTRTESGRNCDDIRWSIRRFHPTVPIFTAANVARGWFDLSGRAAMPAGHAMAFCGLGNPVSFWNLLEAGVTEIIQRWEFGDHHAYTEGEIQKMAAQARAGGARQLLTTEKDAMNLPPGIDSWLDGMAVYWLKLEVQVDHGEALVDLICENLGPRKHVSH
jgi:3-deoxy-D-manno-octulosonic-acid transferase